jgi:hypothetical protein
MDPYIEASGAWSVFHFSFISECGRYLNQRLPPNYVATLGDRIELVSEEDLDLAIRPVGPDVAVSYDPHRAGKRAPAASETPVAMLEPKRLSQDIEWLDEPKQLYVQVRRAPELQVVTEIELLSPSNKRKGGEDRAAYLAKRRALFRHGVNLVEIDLLLGGERLKMRDPFPAGDYFGFVTHAKNAHLCDVYPWSLRTKLPAMPVPLKEDEGQVSLDLASVFDATYDDGRFDMVVAYGEPPAMLSDSDRSWAVEQLKAGH